MHMALQKCIGFPPDETASGAEIHQTPAFGAQPYALEVVDCFPVSGAVFREAIGYPRNTLDKRLRRHATVYLSYLFVQEPLLEYIIFYG